jgi:hypothetical protein
LCWHGTFLLLQEPVLFLQDLLLMMLLMVFLILQELLLLVIDDLPTVCWHGSEFEVCWG